MSACSSRQACCVHVSVSDRQIHILPLRDAIGWDGMGAGLIPQFEEFTVIINAESYSISLSILTEQLNLYYCIDYRY